MTRMVLSFLFMINIFASPTELGNGNDGDDLVEFQEIKDGIIWDSRREAVELLSKINLRGIQGLGILKDEVEKTKLYLTKEGLSAKELLELGAFKSGQNPIVYARTFARSHAATRFYPASLSLSKSQLIAVHIHEGLHRSLPQEIRQNEEVVEEITQVITSPGSTFEDIVSVMNQKLPKVKTVNSPALEIIESERLPKNEKGFFKSSFVETQLGSYIGLGIPGWNRYAGVKFDQDIYTTEKYNYSFNLEYRSYRGLSEGTEDSQWSPSLRLEYEVNDLSVWGYEVSCSYGTSSDTSRINPLGRVVVTFGMDHTKKFESLKLNMGIRYTLPSTGNGSLALLSEPGAKILVDKYGEKFVHTIKRSFFEEYTKFGSIITLDTSVEKFWTEKLSTNLKLSFHKMSSYSSTYSNPNSGTYQGIARSYSLDEIQTDDGPSFPFVAVSELGFNYSYDKFFVRFDYLYLLNSPEVENIGRINLSHFGDPVGRGIGKSGISMTLAMGF